MELGKILRAIKRFLSKHWSRWTILAILAMVIFIGFIFYQYIYKPIYQSREFEPKILEIKKDVYQELMDLYFQRQENINRIITREYADPFK